MSVCALHSTHAELTVRYSFWVLYAIQGIQEVYLRLQVDTLVDNEEQKTEANDGPLHCTRLARGCYSEHGPDEEMQRARRRPVCSSH